MKDNMTPAPQEEVRGVIKKCLESAAYVNYSKISKSARIEGKKESRKSELSFFILMITRLLRDCPRQRNGPFNKA